MHSDHIQSQILPHLPTYLPNPLLKKQRLGLDQKLRVLLLLQRIQVLFPATTCWFKALSSYRQSDIVFQPL